MKRVSRIAYRLIVLAVSFCLIFEQAGFAQVAAQSGIPAYLNGQISAERFRPVQLRSLAYDSLQNNFSLYLDKGDVKNLAQAQIKESAGKLMEYFRTGIVLPNSKFWVNLRPDASDEVIDPELEKTDLGKVLLEADLQLKKDMASFSSPNTPEGKLYWDKLYEKAQTLFGMQEVSVPTLTRPWIVPAEVVIRKTPDSAYIYKATLKVMLEQDYLKDSKQYNFVDPRLKELNDYSSKLMRELIIPRLTREVNSAKRYAALRQVYYSLTLAQWFKQSFNGQDSKFSRLIDANDLSGLTSKTPWSKDTYFNAYQKSFAKGEYDRQETRSSPYGMTIRRYFSGGILPLADASTVKVEVQGQAGVPGNGLLRVDLPGGDPNTVAAIRSTGDQKDLAGKKDGGKSSLLLKADKKAVEDELRLIYPIEYGRQYADLFKNVLRKKVGRFVVQYNPERTGRPRPNDVRTTKPVKSPESNYSKFELEGARAEREFLRKQVVGGVPVEIFSQMRPFGKGHVLLLPGEKADVQGVQPQILNLDAVKVALTLLKESDYEDYLRIGFNSWGAHGSINHLHLQMLFNVDPSGKGALFPIEKVALPEPSSQFKGANIYLFEGHYPVNGFVVEGERVEDLLPAMGIFIEALYAQDDIPFNVIFTKTKAEVSNPEKLRVYVLPNKKGLFNPASALGTGVAFLEKAGELMFIKRNQADTNKEAEEITKTFEDAAEDDLIAELKKVSIEGSEYLALQNDIFARMRESGGVQNPGLRDGGMASVQFLLNLEAGKDYLSLKETYKKLLSLNQVKAVYELEDTINKWEKAKKKDLKAKYQALKREAVWENIASDRNNPLYGLQEALEDKEKANLLSRTETRDTLVRVNDWLIRPGYQGYLVNKLKSMIGNQAWQAVIQCFYMVVDFGTAGKRGQQVEKDRASADVLPGPNIINDYTVAEYTVAQGRYLLATGQAQRGVVLGGDTRIKSSLPRVHKGQSEEAYTDLQSNILRKMGVKVYKFAEPRSIAEAAWATVMLDAASMAYNSASHNLWHDNGVKASNEFSSQLFAKEKDAYKAYLEEVLPEDIAALENAPFKAEEIILNVDKVVIDGEEVADIDGKYIESVRSFVIDRDMIKEQSSKVRSFYTPVQGSGIYTIPRMLNGGNEFQFDVTVSRLQRYQDTEGQFITVDKPDPAYEDEAAKKKTIDVAIKEAEEIEKEKPGYKFDFVCGTDPDSDRSVFAVRDNNGNWKILKANDVWALLGWYMLNQRKTQDRLPEYAIKTWVTTDLVKEIAEDPEFGLTVIEPAVGFNKIAEVALKEIAIPELLGKAQSKDFMKKVEALEKEGKPLTLDFIAKEIKKTRGQAIKEINAILKEKLLFGVEESNGFSPGGHTLEKDAAVAVMIFHEVAAYAKYLNEVIRSGKIAVNNKELTDDLYKFVQNNPGQELTIYNLLNMVYLRYGYFATENKPLTFSDSPQGRQEKEIVLAHLKNRLGHPEAVKFGNRQVVLTKTGNQYMNGYEENGKKVEGHGTNLVFNEPGFRFELNEAGSDYITFRPSGTEPYIRTYGQVKVARDQLDWKNIEQEKSRADQEVTAVVLKAQEYARQNLKFAQDWQAIRSNAKGGFKAKTTVYQAVFDQKQQEGFVDYFKDYNWPGKALFAGLKTIVFDLKTSSAAQAQKKKVIGNGLGVLSVIRQYGQNLSEGLKLQTGKHDLRRILGSEQSRDFLHSIVITSGGQAQRNAKYSQIGKILAKIPMAEKDRQEARYILDGLLDISVNIESNYSENEFMFGIIYGDALISFDPQDLANKLANKETRDNLACMLLKMDYKTSPSYGFAKVNDKGDRVERFQEKYNLIKRDDQGKIVLKEEATAIEEVGSEAQKNLLKQLKETKDIVLLEQIFPSDAERYDLMRRWLDKEGYLTEDKIYMNPAFSIMGIEAFMRNAFISGLVDKDGNIEVDSKGNIVYQPDSYLSQALEGKLPEQKEEGSKINIDYYGNIVPAFANSPKADTISNAIDGKGRLYAVPFEGVWYDTGEIGGEKDINTRQGAKAEDTVKVLQVADTYELQLSVHSQAKINGKIATNSGMDSWAEADEGAVSSLSVMADAYVKAKSLVLGKGSQLYNILFANIDSLEVADNYVLTLSTLQRQDEEYAVPVIWDHRDDMKKGYFGGRSDQAKAETAVLIGEWIERNSLKGENIIGNFVELSNKINALPEKERKLAWRDGVDLYSAKVFPVISIKSLNQWNNGEEVADKQEAELLKELPQIILFLQHKGPMPQTYKDAVNDKRVASRADTYNNQAPGALSQLRKDIKETVNSAFKNEKSPSKIPEDKDRNNNKKSGNSPGAAASSVPDAPGGVDFRAIPVAGRTINPLPLTPRVMQMVNSSSIQELEEEWQDIQGRTLIGSLPCDQLKDYVAACCQRSDTEKQIEEIQAWVNNVLSLEEAAAVSTSEDLKQVLLALG